MRNMVLSALAAALLSAGPAGAAVIHSDNATDFQGWYRGVGSFDVTWDAGAGGRNAVSFDIFGAKSVDGFGNGWDDMFTVLLNGASVFEGYFSLSGGGSDVVTRNPLGWLWSTHSNPGGNFEGGIASISGMMDLIAGQNTLTFAFASPGPYNGGAQGPWDESWAINTLDVTPEMAAVPAPAALPMLAAGLAGLAIARRRRARVAA
jgi:hypothetical protein